MTTTRLCIPFLLTGFCFAQELPSNDALRAAIAVEELEHDPATARTRFEALAHDARLPDAVRRHAWLRLAQLARAAGDDKAAAVAITAAAQGDDAVAHRAQALAQEKPQDPERAKRLEEAAAETVDSYLAGRGAQDADVTWFGDVAVRALARRYTAAAESGQWPTVMRIAPLMWAIPTVSARNFLLQEIANPDENHALYALSKLDGVTPDKAEVLRAALKDARENVVVAALEGGRLLDIDDLAPLLSDPREGVRSHAVPALWSSVMPHFSGMDPADQASISRKLAGLLPLTLDATSRNDQRLASSLLVGTAFHSTEGRKLLAARLAIVPNNLGESYPQTTTFDGDAECADTLAHSIAEIDADSQAVSSRTSHQFVDFMMRQRAWKRPALDAVLQIARHGYLDTELAQWLFRNAKPEDASTIIRGLADSTALCAASSWLANQELAPADYEPLLRTFEMVRKTAAGRNWRPDPLLIALARTGRPEALDVLTECWHQPGSTTARDVLVRAALWHAQLVRSEASRNFLREILTAESDVSPQLRIAIFGELVRLGDMPVWDHYADAVTRTKDAFIPIRTFLPASEDVDAKETARVPDWLTIQFTRNGKSTWWHGYDDRQLLTIWSRLLAPHDGKYPEAEWKACSALAYAANEDPRSVPTQVQVLLCKVHGDRCTQDPGFDPSGTALLPLLWAANQVHPADDARAPALAAFRSAAFTAAAGLVRSETLFVLEPPVDDATRVRVRSMVGDDDETVARRAWDKVIALGIPIDRALIATGFSSTNERTRECALEFAPRSVDGVIDLVTPLLHDPSEDTRVLACKFLAAQVDYASVPTLLETLKDPAETVRRAAAEALQAIRLYHDEKARWARVLGGKPELGTAAAAEALVDRAQGKNDKPTRLLAIRSLGALGAPEPLALLIDWTKDPDADIAQAAREAIQAIHMKSK